MTITPNTAATMNAIIGVDMQREVEHERQQRGNQRALARTRVRLRSLVIETHRARRVVTLTRKRDQREDDERERVDCREQQRIVRHLGRYDAEKLR